jgi:hypothetical protein
METAKEGKAIAEKLGNSIGYYGPYQWRPEGGYVFKDAVTGSSFIAKTYEEAKQELINMRKEFGAKPPTFPGNPGGKAMNALANLNQACRDEGICKGEPSNHELLLHFGIHEAGSPALIVDEATAKATPCTCFQYKGKDLCWSQGAIGMIKQDEQAIYCVAGKTYKAEPALTNRYNRFAAAAEEAHRKIETMPKGKDRLEAWLEAMSESLGKRGITI